MCICVLFRVVILNLGRVLLIFEKDNIGNKCINIYIDDIFLLIYYNNCN